MNCCITKTTIRTTALLPRGNAGKRCSRSASIAILTILLSAAVTSVLGTGTTFTLENEPILMSHSSLHYSAIKKVMVVSPSGLSGDPGDNVTYMFHITNVGSSIDTYFFRVETNKTLWPIVTPQNGTIGPLEPGKTSGDIIVIHRIDENASAYDVCGISFTAWSESEGFSVNDTGYTRTTANPVSDVQVIPPSTGEVGAYPGQTVSLEFTLKNKGNWDDTFDLSVTTQFNWATVCSESVQVKRDAAIKVPVQVTLPSFNPLWTESDFDKNGTFYNTKSVITLTATSKFIPVKSSASVKIRVLPFYQGGISTLWDKASVDYYKTYTSSVRNTAEYLLIISNMNNLPTQDMGTAEISIAIVPPVTTPGTPSWSAALDPPSPFIIKGREMRTVKLIVTEPPSQNSGDYVTTLTAYIKPEAGRVSDPEKNTTFTLQITTIVGIEGGVDVNCAIPTKMTELVVTKNSITINFTVNNYGSGQDTFKLEARTSNGWNAAVINGTSPGADKTNPAYVTIPRNDIITIGVIVDVPDGVSVNQIENLTLTAISMKDFRHPSDNDTCRIVIRTLYRIKITLEKELVAISPGMPLDVNYTIFNLGSNTETVRISYQKGAGSPPGWSIPSQSVEWVMKSNTNREDEFTVSPPAAPKWHETFTLVLRGEIRNTIGQVMFSTETNITFEVRMLVISYPGIRDEINVYGIPGKDFTYHLAAYNLATTGPSNVTVQVKNVPVGWYAYLQRIDKPSIRGSKITSDIMMPYNETLNLMLNISIPSSALDTSNGQITVSTQNLVDPTITDSIIINITLVVLDLEIKRFELSSSEPADGEEVAVTVEISAWSGASAVAGKDANFIDIALTVTSESYSYKETKKIVKLPRGTTENITFIWRVPKLKWYERAIDYSIDVAINSPDESPGANANNNIMVKSIVIKQKTIPAAVSISGMALCGILIAIIIFIFKEIERFKTLFKSLAYASLSLLIAGMTACIFLLPLGTSGIGVLLVLLIFPIPAFILYSYMQTKSLFIGITTAFLTTLAFGLIIGAGSGRPEYISAVFTEEAGGVPYAYLTYMVGLIAAVTVFGILNRTLWAKASSEIARIEMKIKNLKKA